MQTVEDIKVIVLDVGYMIESGVTKYEGAKESRTVKTLIGCSSPEEAVAAVENQLAALTQRRSLTTVEP